MYSKAAVTNSLMKKIGQKCAIKEKKEPEGRSVDELMDRLNLMKH